MASLLPPPPLNGTAITKRTFFRLLDVGSRSSHECGRGPCSSRTHFQNSHGYAHPYTYSRGQGAQAEKVKIRIGRVLRNRDILVKVRYT